MIGNDNGGIIYDGHKLYPSYFIGARYIKGKKLAVEW